MADFRENEARNPSRSSSLGLGIAEFPEASHKAGAGCNVDTQREEREWQSRL